MNRWREILTEDAGEARLPVDPADEAVRVRTRLTDRARDASRSPEERHPWYTDDLSD